jgi:hypothetical protein
MLINTRIKFDSGLKPQALNNTNVTGKYFPLAMWYRLIYVLQVAAMAVTKTAKLEILQAKDAAGTDAKAVTGAEATITANVAVTEATIALASAAATDKVVINGITYTMAAATDATKREFSNAAGLVTCINDGVYGVPGVTATASSTTVTVQATDPGEATVTVEGTNVAGTITVATVEALAFVELSADMLDTNNGFEYVAVKVTTTANTVVAAGLERAEGRFGPEQQVGASKVV